ncbi:hypothetical protein CCHR01_13720 [Colletotrichum chrysophilum]|uniref:Uncharacterized protein n=1 Tax=Colletotrichum chrysophilum TaxID=1836956 RepID=A0AAD9A8Y4_9PEZI|nr:hypothetical protein CCHR01_13720 [Colletotrichum chrysophilum]
MSRNSRKRSVYSSEATTPPSVSQPQTSIAFHPRVASPQVDYIKHEHRAECNQSGEPSYSPRFEHQLPETAQAPPRRRAPMDAPEFAPSISKASCFGSSRRTISSQKTLPSECFFATANAPIYRPPQARALTHDEHDDDNMYRKVFFSRGRHSAALARSTKLPSIAPTGDCDAPRPHRMVRPKFNDVQSPPPPFALALSPLAIAQLTINHPAITQKACTINLAFLDVKPETGEPASLDEHLGIRAAGGMNVDISLAALTTVPVPHECAHDGTGAQHLRLRGGPARIAAKAAAGLRAVCRFNVGGADQNDGSVCMEMLGVFGTVSGDGAASHLLCLAWNILVNDREPAMPQPATTAFFVPGLEHVGQQRKARDASASPAAKAFFVLIEPQAQDAHSPPERPLPQAQEAGNPPARPLPPIPSEKAVPSKKTASSKNAVPAKEAVPSENIVWHESQVQNSRHFQRFYHDPAKYAARNLLTPADMATAARIAPFYSDLQDNELPWPKAWETDAAPLKRKLVHHSWKEALKRNGIDPPPARDGPSNGKDGVDKEGGVSEEGLSNGDADQVDVVNPNNGSASGKEGPAVSSAGQSRVVNSIDTQNHNRPDFSLGPQGLLHGTDLNRSQQHVGSSKPVSYTSAPTLDPKAGNAAGGYGSVGATILAVSDQVPHEPRPRRADREPAVLGLTELCKEGDRDAHVRRFDRWWKQLTLERRKAILEESKQGGDEVQ